jgi:glycosyltransferase involved in cell wall biosynthesis
VPRLRALIVVENLPVPMDRRVWQEALALHRNGWEVNVICPQAAGETETFEVCRGIAIHRYRPMPARGSMVSYIWEYIWAMTQMWRISRRLARTSRFDVAQVCNPPDLLMLPLLPLRRSGTRFIFDHHDLVPELFESRYGRAGGVLHALTRAVERLTFRLADVVISTNSSYRSVAITRGRKPPETVFVVRNAPDTSRFMPTAPDLGLKRGRPFLIAYAGSMGPQDGVDYGLRALAALKQRRRDWHAVFGGDGEVLPEMRRLARDLNLEEDVDFPGWLDDAALAQLFSTADICLAPDPSNPLNDKSTLVKIAEYMAMERPVVCFDLPESRVTAGDAAAYARPNDVDELAQRIAELLDDPERRERMGEIGRDRIVTTLSWEQSERTLLAAYDAALRTTPTP